MFDFPKRSSSRFVGFEASPWGGGEDLNLSISDLQCQAVVGRGTFGVVRLVTPKGKKERETYGQA